MTLRGVNERCTCVAHSRCGYVLDGGLLGASGELSVDENARGKADFALERFSDELVSKGSRRHRCGVGML